MHSPGLFGSGGGRAWMPPQKPPMPQAFGSHAPAAGVRQPSAAMVMTALGLGAHSSSVIPMAAFGLGGSDRRDVGTAVGGGAPGGGGGA